MKVLREIRKPTSPALRKARGITKQAQWSHKQKMEVVQAYLALGNVMLVVAATGVPEDTVRKWKMSQWWKDALEEMKRSQKLQLSGRLKTILEKTVNALEDRVVNGDYVWDKDTMEFSKRRPVRGEILNRITSDLIDKQLILEKAATEERVDDEALDLRLKKLKDEMIKFAKAKTIEGVPYESTTEAVGGSGKELVQVQGAEASGRSPG